jgi:uncharacterized RDD family membrane protein YckC
VAEIHVETPEGITLRHEVAGPGTRTAAGLIDLLIFAAAWTALLLVLALSQFGDATGLTQFAFGLVFGGSLILAALYHIGFSLAMRGQTPGKRLLGVRTIDASGGPAGPLQHVLRGLFWPVETILFVFPIPLALILMTATQRAQRLGDLVAGTVVAREVRTAPAADPAPQQRWSELPRRRLPLVVAHAARLDARDLTFLRELLGRTGLAPASHAKLQSRAARHYLARLGLEDWIGATELAPRAVNLEIYLFLREARGADPRSPTPADPNRAAAEGAPDTARAAAASPR